MNKALIAIVMLCIIGGSTAFQVDAEKCFTQAASFSHQVKGLIAAVQTTPLKIAALLGSAFDTFETVNPLIQGCGLDFPLLDKVDNLKPANATQCFNDIEKLANIALELKAAHEKKDLSENILNVLPQIMDAFKTFKQAQLDCTIVEKKTNLLSSNGFDVNIFKCISEAQITLKNAKQFVADYKAGDAIPMEDLFEEGINVYNEIVVLVRDCGLQKAALPTVNNVSELKTCVKDIKNTVFAVEQSFTDLKSRKFVELLTDAKNIYAAIISDVADCKKSSLLSSSDVFACIADGLSVAKDLKKFVDSAKSKSTKDIVVGAYTVLGELKPMAKDCDLNLPFDLPTINPNDLENCAANTDGLVNTISQLAKDVSDKKLWNIVGDAAAAVAQLKSIVNDCQNKALLSVAADPLTCITKAKGLYEQVVSLIDNSKTKNVPEIVVGAYTIVQSLQPLVSECGLKFDLHIPTITFPDLKGCVVDTQSLISTFTVIKEDFNQKNFLKIFDDAAVVVQTLLTISSECKPIKSLEAGMDVLACLANAKALYGNVDTLIADAKNKAAVNEIVVLSYNTVESLQPLVDSCGLKIDLHIPKITFPDLNGCVVDASGLVNTIKTIRDDVSGKNFSKIFDDVASAVVTLQSIATECKPTKNALETGIDVLACISNAKSLYLNVDTLVADAKSSAPVNQIVVLSYNIIESLQPLVNSCGLTFDLHIPTITFPDLNGCVVDASGLVNTIVSIKNDVVEKRFIDIFDHATEAVITLQNIATECKPIQALQSSVDILACLSNAKALYQNVDTLVADAKNKVAANEIVVLSYNTIESLQPFVDSCGIKVDLHIPKITFPDLSGCVIDTQALVNTIKAIRDDIKSKNFSQIFDDVALTLVTLNQISTECKPTKALLTFNILQCFQSGSKVYSDVKNFLDITKNSKPANEVIVAAFSVLKELQPFLDACDLKVDLHIPDIDFNDLNGCVVDTSNIINDFKTLSKQLGDKNYIAIIGTVQTAIAHVKGVADECKVHKNSKFALQANLLTCAKEAQTMFKRASALVSEFKSKQVADVVVSAYDIVENLQILVDACVPKKVDLHIPKIAFANLKSCVVDVQTVISIVKTIKNDVSVKNWTKIIGDAKSFVSTFSTIKNDCAASKLSLDPSKVLQCLSSAKQVYEDVQNIVNINKEKRPVNEIVVSAFGLVEEVQPFLDVCGIKADLHIPQIDFNDLNGCVVDGEKIVNSLKTLAADLKSKNLLNLVADIQAILASSKNVATECKTQKKPALEASLNLKCIKQVGNIAKDAFKVYKDLNNDNSDVLQKLLTIEHFLTDLQPACNDCGIKANIPTIPSDSKIIATVECASDVTKLVSSIGSLYTDATSLNVIKVVSDVKTIISSFSDAKDKCTSISKQTL